MTTGSFHPEMPPRETPSTSPVSPRTNVSDAGDVVAADAVGLGELVQDQAAPEPRRRARAGR